MLLAPAGATTALARGGIVGRAQVVELEVLRRGIAAERHEAELRREVEPGNGGPRR